MNQSEIIIGKHTAHPLTVRKPGYGTMRLTGPDIWGEPADRNSAIQLLRRAADLGVNFFDTADFYGPGITNKLLADAFYPYSGDLIFATKVGAIRGADKSWQPYARPEELRKSVENNLKELKLEQLPLVHLGKRQGSEGDYEESFEAMLELQKEGKILHLGLTNVNVAQFKYATGKTHIATVENLYSYTQRITDPESPFAFQGGEVLTYCEQQEIPFIPFFSLQTSLPTEQQKLKQVADAHGISVAQLNLVWLLHTSEWILPIPGTTSIRHLEENIAAATMSLSKEEMDFLG
ncbi:aldo/keto reductase [Chitinophaga pinensis]|uniref:Aldo/keto reductase n=1 Tax=Chitinophaga pinensis (strain ATCC 43595 / DSM 2588 / LMG 13176 / NBRC 15968 / NCIMB 11800 / UQM 2034) TaxID=485918 RepID=A0A979G3M4_CHIPD|nr:aldo/keto reductase [Chitinophaga pinensis]ACU60312.1 aldo/keto reductase [Chitinophaga pinensis DSM 2588]